MIAALVLAGIGGKARADDLSPTAFLERYGAHHSPAAHAGHHVVRGGAGLIAAAKRYLGDGNVTGFRGPWCGAFLGMIARRVGLPRPHNFRLARAWLHVGRPVKPRPGAVVVFARRGGGHVGIVTRVRHGRVHVISGNHGHRVAMGWYPIRRALGYRAL